MELCIKEKELSLPEKFDIYDENGNIKYYVVKKNSIKTRIDDLQFKQRMYCKTKAMFVPLS